MPMERRSCKAWVFIEDYDDVGFDDYDVIDDVCDVDADSDGIPNFLDNCPNRLNVGQNDKDGDR